MSSIKKKYFAEIRCTSAGDSGKKFHSFFGRYRPFIFS